MVEQSRDRMQAQPGERPVQPSVQDNGRSTLAEQSLTMGRPGLVTYAAIMMFALGGFHVLLAISEFARSTWVLSGLDTLLIIHSLIIWGIIDVVIGFVAIFAGASILRGGAFGWIVGCAFASLGIIRWLFYIPISPVLAVVIIVLDVLVIYGLAKHTDYVQDAR